MDFYKKYIKYKLKYLKLQEIIGGTTRGIPIRRTKLQKRRRVEAITTSKENQKKKLLNTKKHFENLYLTSILFNDYVISKKHKDNHSDNFYKFLDLILDYIDLQKYDYYLKKKEFIIKFDKIINIKQYEKQYFEFHIFVNLDDKFLKQLVELFKKQNKLYVFNYVKKNLRKEYLKFMEDVIFSQKNNEFIFKKYFHEEEIESNKFFMALLQDSVFFKINNILDDIKIIEATPDNIDIVSCSSYEEEKKDEFEINTGCNLIVFNQSFGICWLSSIISTIFFSDDFKKYTWKGFFEIEKCNGFTIPRKLNVDNINKIIENTPELKKDLEKIGKFFLILEIIRNSLEIQVENNLRLSKDKKAPIKRRGSIVACDTIFTFLQVRDKNEKTDITNIYGFMKYFIDYFHLNNVFQYKSVNEKTFYDNFDKKLNNSILVDIVGYEKENGKIIDTDGHCVSFLFCDKQLYYFDNERIFNKLEEITNTKDSIFKETNEMKKKYKNTYLCFSKIKLNDFFENLPLKYSTDYQRYAYRTKYEKFIRGIEQKEYVEAINKIIENSIPLKNYFI